MAIGQDFTLGESLAVDENILVIGQTGSLFRSLSQERAADNVIRVLSADAIGQFPDQNPAESLRRVVGISVEPDQGEGRYVIIRGVDPNLNTTTINGVRVPSPEGDDRKVALDVIAAELVDEIVVTKSFTPDLDGDAIGGNVEIKTLSGFDREVGTFAVLSGAGSYSDIVGKWGPKLSAIVTHNWDDKLAVAAALSYYERDFGSDNREVGGWEEEDLAAGGVALVPEEIELRDYEITRERFSATLNFDFRPTDNTDLYLRTLYSRFKDDEERSTTTAGYTDGAFNGSASHGSLVVFDAGADDEIEYVKEMKDREETQEILSIALGGATYLGDWIFDYSAGYSHAEEEEPDRLDTVFTAEIDEGSVRVDTSDKMAPKLGYSGGAYEALFDTDNYEFDEAVYEDNVTEDDEFSLKLDIERELTIADQYPGAIKFGAKARFREKDRDNTATIYDGFDGDDDYLLTPVATTVDYDLDDIGPLPDAGDVRDFFDANRHLFEVNDLDSAIDSAVADYEAEEDVIAGYLMGRGEFARLRVVGGLRVERTDFDATGREVLVDADTDTVEIREISSSDSYTDILPSINFRYDMDDLVLRAAYFRSIARPNIVQVVPSAEIEEEAGKLEAELGNPDLDRQRADNFDLGLAWYPNDDSVLSLNLFHKEISDYIATQGFEDIVYNGVFYDDAVMAVNLDDSRLTGAELAYHQRMSFLPSPWDGLLIGANLTLVDGEATLRGVDGSSNGRDIPLPKQSETLYNLILGYEKGPVSMRLALAHRGEYLDEINGGGEGIDRYVDDHTQLDFRAQYDFGHGLAAFVELVNLTDEPFEAYFDQGGRALLSQYEEYGISGLIGVRYTME